MRLELKTKLLGFCTALFLFAFCASFSGNSLSQGQQIKQFASYSVTHALNENGFKVWETYWPCVDVRNGKYPRPWAEEPPVFYLYSGLLDRIGLGPQWAPLIIFFFLNCVLFLLLYEYVGNSMGLRLFLLSATVPVQMRYSYQHMPDMMATLFLLCALLSIVKNKKILFVVFLIFAVTTKALAVIPGAMFLAYVFVLPAVKRGESKAAFINFLKAAALVAVVAFPFVLWVSLLWSKGIPNPFDFRSPLTNRHSGGFQVVFTPYYWDRLFTFIGTKGVGWILFICFFLRLKSDWKRRSEWGLLEGLLIVWGWSFVPFWILVRQASTIHDHYVLQYGLGIGILGAHYLVNSKRTLIRDFFVVLSILVGMSNPVVWRLRTDQMKPPSKFCEQEEHSLVKFPLKVD